MRGVGTAPPRAVISHAPSAQRSRACLPFVAAAPHIQLAVIGEGGGVSTTARELPHHAANLHERRLAAEVAELTIRVRTPRANVPHLSICTAASVAGWVGNSSGVRLHAASQMLTSSPRAATLPSHVPRPPVGSA